MPSTKEQRQERAVNTSERAAVTLPWTLHRGQDKQECVDSRQKERPSVLQLVPLISQVRSRRGGVRQDFKGTVVWQSPGSSR